MFTGIIAAVGSISALDRRGGDVRVTIDTAALDISTCAIGDSIAVNGVCLTAVALAAHRFDADVSQETLQCSTLGEAQVGYAVNLELALTAQARLGGHFVSGHVDGIGSVESIVADGRSQRLRFAVPAALARYIAQKGSICVDGVSLTVNAVAAATFEVNIVPHTLNATIMHAYKVGTKVNIEVDLLARYLERLLMGERAKPGEAISAAFLAENGFLKK